MKQLPCQICGKPSEAHKLCAKHLKRWQRHGHTDPTRPSDWGAKERHPLYQRWTQTKRAKEGRVKRWEDLWSFVADVGTPPEGKQALRRYRVNEPWGPDNYYWIEWKPSPERNARVREYRVNNRIRVKGYELKRNHGLTLEQYDGMLEAQHGKCAICGNGEHVTDSTGKTRALAVDHCHESGRVRGLLCTNCNKMIGHAKDSEDILLSALAYLRQHSTES